MRALVPLGFGKPVETDELFAGFPSPKSKRVADDRTAHDCVEAQKESSDSVLLIDLPGYFEGATIEVPPFVETVVFALDLRFDDVCSVAEQPCVEASNSSAHHRLPACQRAGRLSLLTARRQVFLAQIPQLVVSKDVPVAEQVSLGRLVGVELSSVPANFSDESYHVALEGACSSLGYRGFHS